MNTMEKAALLLETFACSQNITDLAFGEDGECALVDAQERIVHLQLDAENGRIICLAAVGGLPSPVNCRPEVLYDLLVANFCWTGSCEATVAVEPQSGQVILQQALLLEDADADVFSRFINTFIQLVEYWEERLRQILETYADDNSPFGVSEEEAVTENMIRV